MHAQTQHVLYGPWGNVEAVSGDSLPVTRLGWKGLVWEGGTAQLYYVRSRWYDPQSQSFLSEDPLGLNGGRNTYAYADNDPVNGWDPSGLTMDDPGCFFTAVWKYFLDTGFMVNGTLRIIGMTPECTKPAGGQAGGRGGGGGSRADTTNHLVKYTALKRCPLAISPTLAKLLGTEWTEAENAQKEYGGYVRGEGVNTTLDAVPRSNGRATSVAVPLPVPLGTTLLYHTHLYGSVKNSPNQVYAPGPDSHDSAFVASAGVPGVVVARDSFFLQTPPSPMSPQGTTYGCAR